MRALSIYLLFAVLIISRSFGQYNQLVIPPVVKGVVDPKTKKRVYKLTAQEGISMFFGGNGQSTKTAGYNGIFLGPTLMLNKGDSIQMEVTNLLNESTTVHWHGIHLPAVMDGGPYQAIPHGCTWKPYWTVMDNPATYWYHPHLDEQTNAQVILGLAGMIIVNDPAAKPLPLPTTYGVDDIPLILTDRRFDTDSQFSVGEVGDTLFTNGVLHASTSLPSQVVRFRILNGSTFRCYNIGLSTNDEFAVLATDGGLLTNPAKTKRYILAPGERIEILVNLAAIKNKSFNMMAFNSELGHRQPGGWHFTKFAENSPFGNFNDKLECRNFSLLQINVATQTKNPITSIPKTLDIKNDFPDPKKVTRSRDIKFTWGYPKLWDSTWTNPAANDSGCFIYHFGSYGGDTLGFGINNHSFVMDTGVINANDTSTFKIMKDGVEKWTLRNATAVSHIFHIHDVQFHIIAMTDSTGKQIPVPAYYNGWKDVIMVDSGASISFVAQFSNYADTNWAYMYHCHMLVHEDGGMMGQFWVVNKGNTGSQIKIPMSCPLNLTMVTHHLTAANKLILADHDPKSKVYYMVITDKSGRVKMMLPNPDVKAGVDVSSLKPGVYHYNVVDTKHNVFSRRFTKK